MTLALLASGLACLLLAHTAINLRFLRSTRDDAPTVLERVSLLVPARDEVAHIASTVRSLLAQEGLADMECIVLDDGSRDGTGELLDAIEDPRLRVIHAPDLPPPAGWLGKPWACARLAEAASGSVLVFADADVVFAPQAVRGAVQALREGHFALASPFPRQVAGTWLERLVQPLVTWAWIATMPLRWSERSTRPSLTAANGQFLVVDAAAYRAIGGHGAVRDAVLEDIGLMRAFRRAGHRTVTLDGTRAATCRMYDSARAVVDGYAKSLWAAFRGPLGSIAVNGMLLFAFVLPAAFVLLPGDPRTRGIGGAGYLAGVASRWLAARRMGDRRADAFLHPLSMLAFLALNLVSWTRHVRRRNAWKGRAVRVSG